METELEQTGEVRDRGSPAGRLGFAGNTDAAVATACVLRTLETISGYHVKEKGRTPLGSASSSSLPLSIPWPWPTVPGVAILPLPGEDQRKPVVGAEAAIAQ